mmetsp:Transcript_22936/g.41320  ORF Transcript_22936/g.41320 Transcript_22936/m.41320 type:complete len:247 (+) Transcript_22936:967-1707(+)
MGSIFLAPPAGPPRSPPPPAFFAALAANIFNLNAWKSNSFMHAAWGNRRDSFAKRSLADELTALSSFPVTVTRCGKSLSTAALRPSFDLGPSLLLLESSFVLESSFTTEVIFSGLESAATATFASSDLEDRSSIFGLARSCRVIMVGSSSACGCGELAIVSAACARAPDEGSSIATVSADCDVLLSSSPFASLFFDVPASNATLSLLSSLPLSLALSSLLVSPIFPLVTVVRMASLTFFMASDVAL